MKTGDEVFVIRKAQNCDNYLVINIAKRRIDKPKENPYPYPIKEYWLRDMEGNGAGSAEEYNLFPTKKAALKAAIIKLFKEV